jgi:polyferredoxin
MYLTLWSGIGAAMLFALGTRTRIDISAQQDRNPVAMRLSDGAIRNAYTVKLRNMESRPRPMRVTVEGLAGFSLWTDRDDRADARTAIDTMVPPDSVAKLRVFVAASAPGPQRQDFAFTVRATDRQGAAASEPAHFERLP